MRYLTFALTKGRLASKTLDMLERLGITCEEMKDKDSRKLIFTNEELEAAILPCKGTGCPYLCGIRGGGYRSRRKGHDHRRRQESARGA